MQRLHIEHLTRHPPKRVPPKPFASRLAIYNIGRGVEAGLTLLRVTSLSVIAFSALIYVPAYAAWGSPWYILLPIWLSSFLPAIVTNYTTRSVVIAAWLRLPKQARPNPTTAMTYARNLPPEAELEFQFLRWTGFGGTTLARIMDLKPIPTTNNNIKRWWRRQANFEVTGHRADRGTWLRPNPVQFSVNPSTAGGKAARNTIPGLWDVVYKRLTGVTADTATKWKR
jgi:hypothetical protein